MGFRERIGLKPKSSSANLSAGLNSGGNRGYGFNGGPQQPMYSIPESGFASGPAQHQQQYQQQQPRTTGLGGGIPFASRPGPQPSSFEANRSTSSGSTYSFSTNGNAGTAGSNFGSSTTSFTTTSTGTSNNSNSFGAGIRNFSGNSAKSNSTAKTAQQAQYQPKDPQITAADVRRCTKMLRQMFELHLELWTLTYTHETDQYRRHQKRMQVEAIRADIHHLVYAWHSMPRDTWSEEEYAEIQWIATTLADLPPPPY